MRDSLGRKREHHLRIVPIAILGQLWLGAAAAQQAPDSASRTIAVLEITDQPFVRLLSSVHELNGLSIPGGLVDLRALLPDDSATIAAGQRVFVVLRPFALPRTPNPIVFELPQIPNAMVHNTWGDNQQRILVIEYGRGDTLVTRRTVSVVDPHHIRVQDQAIRDHR